MGPAAHRPYRSRRHPAVQSRRSASREWSCRSHSRPRSSATHPQLHRATRRAGPLSNQTVWRSSEGSTAAPCRLSPPCSILQRALPRKSLGSFDLIPDLVVFLAARNVFPEIDPLLVVLQVIEVQILLFLRRHELRSLWIGGQVACHI